MTPHTRTVLVVEDDRALRKALVEYLERKEFTVRVAEDGVKGLAIALSERPALIILDLRLPGLLGDELLHQLRGAGPPQPHVIVLTNDERMMTVGKVVEDGVTDYLVKADVSLARVVALAETHLPPAPYAGERVS